MKKKYCVLLLLSLFWLNSFGQIDACPDTLFLCEGRNCIENPSTSTSAGVDTILSFLKTIYVTSSNVSVGTIRITNIKSDSIGICFDAEYIQISPGIAHFNYYYVGTDGFQCGGIVKISDSKSLDIKTKCGWNFNNGGPPKFCPQSRGYFTIAVGDTSIVDIITPESDTSSYYQVKPSDISVEFGKIIDFTEKGFKIVWDKAGSGCLEFSQNGKDCLNRKYYAFEVMSKTNFDFEKNYYEICEGDQINIKVNFDFLLDSYYSDYTWAVSDGRKFKNVSEIDLSFPKAGEYTVTFEKNTYCVGLGSRSVKVVVKPGRSPKIDFCESFICANEEATYYALNDCKDYKWKIDNGEIIEGGKNTDDFVKVKWTQGPTGTITLTPMECDSQFCRTTEIKKIDILDKETIISGPSQLCEDEIYYEYYVPFYKNVEYTWYLDSVLDAYSNTHSFQPFLPPRKEPYKIKVQIENCLTGCKSVGELDVYIKKRFNIISSSTIACIGSEKLFTTNINTNVSWKVIQPNGSVLTFSDDSLKYKFSAAGKYSINAINDELTTCNNSDTLTYIVEAPPSYTPIIEGPKNICIGESSSYSVKNLLPKHKALWNVYDGNLSKAKEILSNKLTYQWQNSIYKLEVKIQDSETGCLSDATIIPLQSIWNVYGIDTICLGKASTHTMNLFNKGKSKWTIEPDSAGIMHLVKDSTISALWLREGNHKLIGEFCGIKKEIKINIPKVAVDYTLSYNKECNQLPIKISSVLPLNYTIKIKNEDQKIIAANLDAVFPAGKYFTEIESNYGCKSIIEKDIELFNHDTFKIQAISAGPFAWCLPQDSIIIYVRNPKPDYTYEWYENGKLLSEKSWILKILKHTTYYVIVTNGNGCKAKSEEFTFIPIGKSFDAPILFVNKIDTNCFMKSYEILSPYKSTSFNWTITKDGKVYDVKNNSTNYSNVFKEAGIYIVEAKGDFCNPATIYICDDPLNLTACEGFLTRFIIPYEAKYIVKRNCDPLSFNFINKSIIIKEGTGFNYKWNFGDPSSTANISNEESPNHIFSSYGKYTVSLEINDDKNCSSTFSQEVAIKPYDTIDFTAPLKICLGSKADFIASSADTSIYYKWIFGDPGSSSLNFSKNKIESHYYTKQGKYDVKLIGYLKGCPIDSVFHSLDVIPNELNGKITSNITLPKCPEQTATLTYTTTNTEPLTYQWSNGEKSNSISVITEGQYGLQIENAFGCRKVIENFEVNNLEIPEIKIWATKKEDYTKYYFDSITVCENTELKIHATQIPGYLNKFTYLSKNYYNSQGFPSNSFGSGIGNNFVSLELLHNFINTNKCQISTPSFLIKNNEYPEIPIITASKDRACLGDTISLTIANYNSSNQYKWSDEPSYNAKAERKIFSSGAYRVTSRNSIGCEVTSTKAISIYPIPNLFSWLSGCKDLCLPTNLCLKLQNDTYTLIKDNKVLKTLPNNQDAILNIDSVGEYKLKITNGIGCVGYTDILSITQKPNIYRVLGKVYLDKNNNKKYDEGIDSLLPSIKVTLANPSNNLYDSLLTNTKGSFDFDSLVHKDLLLNIAYKDYTNQLINFDSLLNFSTCNETKVVNLPIYFPCTAQVNSLNFSICEKDSLVYNGNTYFGNNVDTLYFTASSGCDSIILINTKEVKNPTLDLKGDSICFAKNTGIITINDFNNDNIYYLNNNTQILNKTLIDISKGEHKIKVVNNLGCSREESVTIGKFPEIEVNVKPLFSCKTNLGELIIEGKPDYVYSLYLFNNFSSLNTIIDSLKVGTHTLFIKDKNACLDSLAFEIKPIEKPKIELITTQSCENINNGIVTINNLSNQSLKFKVDNYPSFIDLSVLRNIGIGVHTLYYKDESDCIHEKQFSITPFPTFDIAFEVKNICEEKGGSIKITNVENVIEWSIDDKNNFTNQTELAVTTAGIHRIYYINKYECQDSSFFEIAQVNKPIVKAEVIALCEDLNLGEIKLFSDSIGYLFNIKGNYDTLSHFKSLSKGNYSIKIKNKHGCDYNLDVIIPEFRKPKFEIIVKNSCEESSNGSLEINFDADTLNYSLNGADFSTSPNFTDLKEGSYTLFYLTPNGCLYNEPFIISSFPLPNAIISTENSCDDTTSGKLIITATAEGNLFSVNGGTYSNKIEYNGIGTGTYNVKIKNENECVKEIEVKIEEHPPLEVEFPIFELDCYTDEIEITPIIKSASSDVKYQWSDGSKGSSIKIAQSGLYSTNVSDLCSTRSEVWSIDFIDNDLEGEIFAPNIFATKSNAPNNCFKPIPHSSAEVISYSLQIYDRWGNLMFTTLSQEDCWDGRFNGTLVEQGVYVYMVEMEILICGIKKRVKKVRDVTVI